MVVIVVAAVSFYSHFPNRAVVDDHSHRLESCVLLDLFPPPLLHFFPSEVPYRAGVLLCLAAFRDLFFVLFPQVLLGNPHLSTSLNLGVY